MTAAKGLLNAAGPRFVQFPACLFPSRAFGINVTHWQAGTSLFKPCNTNNLVTAGLAITMVLYFPGKPQAQLGLRLGGTRHSQPGLRPPRPQSRIHCRARLSCDGPAAVHQVRL